MPPQAKALHALVKKRTARPPMDWPLLIIVLTLVGFGLVMLFSSSYPAGYYRFGDSYEFIRPQMFYAAVGIIAMLIISHIDYHILHRFALPLMARSIVLLILVLVIGSEYNGAKRWINLGFGTLQPSEIAKFAVIALFAHIVSLNHEKMKTFRYGVLPFLLVLGTIAGLMLLEPHLSGTIIILGIGVILVFVASPKYGQFVFMGLLGIGFMTIFLALESYRLERLAIWRNPEAYEKGYQTLQGLYAIGSGGLFGRGIGQSVQKLGFVPEAQNDMIFSIICEELGLFGAGFVLILFLILIWRFFVIATHSRDLFGALIATGAMAHMMIQVILNIAVVTNTIPNTGITLPFVSYGGTSLVFLLLEMGLVLSVSSLVK